MMDKAATQQQPKAEHPLFDSMEKAIRTLLRSNPLLTRGEVVEMMDAFGLFGQAALSRQVIYVAALRIMRRPTA